MTQDLRTKLTAILLEANASGELSFRDYEQALASIKEDRDRAARIQSYLALLDSPRPGTVVVGEGFEWRFDVVSGTWDYYFGARDTGFWQDHEQALPMLRALVSCGGASVRLPAQEVGS